MSDWKSRATPVQPAKSSWRDRAEPVEKEKTGQLTAAIRGGVQGISGGFADELAGGIGGAIDYVQGEGDLKSLYEKNRDEQRAKNEQSKKDWPKTYGATQIGASVVPTVLTAGTSIPAMAASGAAQGLGYSEADLTKGEIGQAAKDTAIGGVIGGGAGAVVQGVSRMTPTVVNYLSGLARRNAAGLAVNGTGATGLQASRMAPGTGEFLLDNGITRFGSTAEGVANRAGEAMRQSGDEIGRVLETLDNNGVTASVDNVVAALQRRITELDRVPGNERIVRQLTDEIDTLIQRGQSDLPASLAEEAKRAYQSNVNYNSPEVDKKAATHLASAFRNEVERVAENADPALANTFREAKRSYGILSPVEEAATRRTAVLEQSPLGGLGDMVAGGVGGVPGVAAKRFIAPRVANSLAVTLDGLSRALAASPEIFGRYASALQNAAAKGSANLAITHQVLQKDPEYQKILNGL
jgi:hypothetical protein